MKNGVNAILVDSFAPAQSPLASRLNRPSRGLPSRGILTSRETRGELWLSSVSLGYGRRNRGRMFMRRRPLSSTR